MSNGTKIKVHKTENFTVMSNNHFKEKKMSLKAKGKLSLMLSLPDDWDYSIKGLISLSLDNSTSVKSALVELKKFGYLEVKKEREKGRFVYTYNVYEIPKNVPPDTGFLAMEKPPLEFLALENLCLYKDTKDKILNNKILNNKSEKKIKKENANISDIELYELGTITLKENFEKLLDFETERKELEEGRFRESRVFKWKRHKKLNEWIDKRKVESNKDIPDVLVTNNIRYVLDWESNAKRDIKDYLGTLRTFINRAIVN